ncbi:flagellar hook-basal body complex protein [Puniceibacterium confluentis]|uniref:flagellar hook-basal body complex protein n=1 Tax=Puniceibacterium confluentis TaxID=1958944 RepID=UPI0011B83A9C|nr:flagellar hook-basal body complex protein [Puniceibacterium confluentis]
METAGYTTLTRQSGLMREMQVIANNIANTATTGFRQEGVIFSEHVARTDLGSISMATAQIHNTSTLQGTLTQTGGQFDIGIQGEGFFLVQTPQGERLTRAGAFSPNADGDLVTPDGHPVLDPGGAPIFIPPDATDLAIAQDGTLSSRGRPLGQIGVVQPVDFNGMVRQDGTLFESTDGFDPVVQPKVMQGFLEASNVNAVGQIARMIEVQRAYEMGQSFLESENQRITDAIKTFIK